MSESVTIDLITRDATRDEYVLYLLEEAPWPADEAGWEQRLLRIQQRVLGAVDIAVAVLAAAPRSALEDSAPAQAAPPAA